MAKRFVVSASSCVDSVLIGAFDEFHTCTENAVAEATDLSADLNQEFIVYEIRPVLRVKAKKPSKPKVIVTEIKEGDE